MQIRTAFRVRELDCAEEIPPLKKGLLSHPGILGLDFDLLNSKMTVAYEDTVTSSSEILKRIAVTGMHGTVWQDAADVAVNSSRIPNGRLLATAISGVCLLAGLVTHLLLSRRFLEALHGVHPPQSVCVLYSIAIVAGGWYVAPRAWTALRKLRADMHLLMCIAAAGAVLLGEWLEGAAVAFLFALSLLLEQWSVGRARRAVAALIQLSPPTARIVCPRHGGVEEQRVEQVPVGATALVRPGERIPLDGVILSGNSHINEATITGESLPVNKSAGSELFAGTLNGDGALEFRVTRPASETLLARLTQLVQEARSRRAPAEQWVEKFAQRYTPAMLLLAVGLVLLPPLVFSVPWNVSIYRGLVTLVIACPCALVISTPVSVVSALTSAARRGVLIKGGVALEAAAGTCALALDKTGTLTTGTPEVQQIFAFSGHTPQEVLERAQALEFHSQHPLGQAILRKASSEGVSATPAAEFRELSGRGAEGLLQGRRFWVGSHRLMHEQGGETDEVHSRALAMEDAGNSVIAVGNEGHVCGLLGVADDVRPEARSAIDALRKVGIRRIVMLTGDNRMTAQSIATQTGVDEFHAELLPDEKLGKIEELMREFGAVAMVGDGVNDAPAMARATVSIAMGAAGTDVAIETADIALMSDDLRQLAWLIQHARRTLRIIKANIAFALGIKLVFLLLTLVGMASLWAAIAADTGATLVVIFNALRLLSTSTLAPEPDRRSGCHTGCESGAD